MEDHYRDQLFKVQELTEFRPCPAIGSLLYLSVISRPDITIVVRLLAQELEHPTDSVKNGVDRVFRNINGTRDFGLTFRNGVGHGLVVYWTGYAIYYDVCLVEWDSKKQSMVTLSSTEAEYIAMSTGGQE
ncbi:polyprotein [Phytophthora megakarya]|uniref:Polyprotein n=1 Tax=Phytophthora megakarya TaxID=4795 RepID=A0A225VQU5_9STRA|nr:polyprotein [Phytophthora megakarya]